MAKEKDQLLGHAADNDGIDEYDNPLPDWWLGLFYFSILFAIGYTVEYHFISHRSQAKYYDEEIAAAKVKWPDADKPKMAVLDAETISAGEEVFKANCVACHGANLKGGIGPDLTDATWIHGGKLEEISNTVTVGVAAKGMPTWGPILGPDKVSKVSAYVYIQTHPEEKK